MFAGGIMTPITPPGPYSGIHFISELSLGKYCKMLGSNGFRGSKISVIIFKIG